MADERRGDCAIHRRVSYRRWGWRYVVVNPVTRELRAARSYARALAIADEETRRNAATAVATGGGGG
jgi:hypothetical protein